MRKSLLLALLVLFGFGAQGQIVGPSLLAEGFEGSFPPTGWSSVNASSGLNWSKQTGNTVYPSGYAPYAGSSMARLNSFSVSTGSADLITPALSFNYTVGTVVVSFWMFRDNGYNSTPDKVDVYVNTTASSSGGTLLGTVNRPNGLSPTVSSNGWYQYSFTVPSSFNGTTNYIIFRGSSGYGNDVYIDNVNIYRNLPTPPPAPMVTSNGTTPTGICAGNTLTITATDPNGYPNPTFTLTGPGIASMSNSTGIFNIPNVSSANAGTYNATLTSGTSTSNVGSVSVTVLPVSNISVSSIATATTCTSTDGGFTLSGLVPSSSFKLTYTKGTTTTTIPATGTYTASSTGTYTVTGLTAGVYTNVYVTNGTCPSNRVNVTIPTLASVPATPSATSNSPVCPRLNLVLSITGTPLAGGTYQWTDQNSNVIYTGSSPNDTIRNVTPAMAGTYCVTVTASNQCQSAQSCTNVTVNNKDPKPVVPAAPIVYCQYETALPLMPTGPGLTWFGPWQASSTGQILCPTCPDSSRIPRASIVPRTDIPTGLGQGFVYGVVQNSTCPSDTAYVIVTVKPKPAKPTVPPGTVDYCQFSPASPLSAGGANIRWFSTPTGGTGTATAPTPVTIVPGTYFFYVSQTVNGCESDRAMITVNVKPKPAPPGVTSPINLCQGDPVGPLTAIGQNLLWYTAAAGGVGVTVAPIPNTGYEDSFMYWVSQSVNGCESDRALIQAFVNYKPNGVIVGATQSLCQNQIDTFYYYGNARDSAQFVWNSPISMSHVISGQGTKGPFIVRFDSAGTAVVRLQINNKGCISTLIAAPITVRHLPKIDYSLKRDVCKDELVDISLTKTEPGITDFMFDFGSNDTTMVYSAPPGGPFGIRYHTPGEYTVAATATLDQCTSLPLEKRITVHDLPNAKITAPSRDLGQEVCASDTITLSVQAVPEGATYTWTPAAYFQSLRDSLNYIVRAVVSQTSPVKVHIVTAYGCEAEDSVIVTTKPCCGVFFPTAFAPEGNVPQNRRFRPITIGFHQVNNFRIINRWGQVVYETKAEPHGLNAGWDGTYNGVKQDMGTYFYYINYKCDGKNIEEHGEVTLMR